MKDKWDGEIERRIKVIVRQIENGTLELAKVSAKNVLLMVINADRQHQRELLSNPDYAQRVGKAIHKVIEKEIADSMLKRLPSMRKRESLRGITANASAFVETYNKGWNDCLHKTKEKLEGEK